jgi:peptidoglycan/xylan/chitin deacetylase (PgdA/CDA1 family)
MKNLITTLLLFISLATLAQEADHYTNKNFIKALNNDTTYVTLRSKITQEYIHTSPGSWGEFVKDVDEDIKTKDKVIALTFDACGREKGTGFDQQLINYLLKENLPATLFVTGRWIDEHFETFMSLSKEKTFEIENHGLNHKPCSIDGESEYGIHGTATVSDAFDEIEANARKIEALTNHKPKFYRSATAFIDEACAKMARKLNIQAISFQVLSGDAVPFTPTNEIEENVLKNIKPGAIVIMHMNHPQWNTFEALEKIIPKLKAEGYRFVQLKDFPLYSIKGQD